MPTFIFKSTDLTEPELRTFKAELDADPHTPFTVSQEVRTAAEEKILAKAREVAFTTKRPIDEAITHVMEQNPALAKLSRAQADTVRAADVTVL